MYKDLVFLFNRKGLPLSLGSDFVRTFDMHIQQKVHKLSVQVYGIPAIAASTPAQYAGELLSTY